jgi:hypothetical protein
MLVGWQASHSPIPIHQCRGAGSFEIGTTMRALLLALGQGAAVRIGIIGFVIAHGAELMALMAGRL